MVLFCSRGGRKLLIALGRIIAKEDFNFCVSVFVNSSRLHLLVLRRVYNKLHSFFLSCYSFFILIAFKML